MMKWVTELTGLTGLTGPKFENGIAYLLSWLTCRDASASKNQQTKDKFSSSTEYMLYCYFKHNGVNIGLSGGCSSFREF